MNLFDVLTLIGGLAMFLFGMSVMGEGLEKSAGNSLKSILERLTSNPVKGFLMGVSVTAVIQSSSATTVMVVGFVNSGIMSLHQAIGIIMGANVGTTVTSWLLSLTGIDSSVLWIQLLKPSSFSPVLAAIGVVMYVFLKDSKKKDIGSILLGFAVLMYGMETMSGAVEGLKSVPEFTSLLLMFTNPILGVLAGALLTAIMQSSSASVGILQALSATGSVTFGSAIPIICGQNIGTTVTAMISSIGTSRNARRAALVHFYFNIIGTIVFLGVFYLLNAILQFSWLSASVNQFYIAIVHTVFNIVCTAAMLPLTNVLEKLAYITVPEPKEKEEAPSPTSMLDERLMVTPAVALAQCRKVAEAMAVLTMQAYDTASNLIDKFDEEKSKFVLDAEDKVDEYEDALGTYLVQLASKALSAEDSVEVSTLLHATNDIERISDYAKSIAISAQQLKENGVEFSARAQQEMNMVSSAVSETLRMTVESFQSNNAKDARRVEPLEQVVDDMCDNLKERHIRRLKEGTCSLKQGFIFTDLLSEFSRVSDHCSNIAACIIEASQNSMNTHQYVSQNSKQDNFRQAYVAYREKYQIDEDGDEE